MTWSEVSYDVAYEHTTTNTSTSAAGSDDDTDVKSSGTAAIYHILAEPRLSLRLLLSVSKIYHPSGIPNFW